MTLDNFHRQVPILNGKLDGRQRNTRPRSDTNYKRPFSKIQGKSDIMFMIAILKRTFRCNSFEDLLDDDDEINHFLAPDSNRRKVSNEVRNHSLFR